MFIRSHFLSPDPVVAPAPPAVPPVSVERQASDLTTQLIAQYGTVENALRGLVTKSITTDQTLAQQERTIADLKAKVPADGSVVLPKAEAESFAKLKALGTVDEIVAGMKERGELKGETDRTRREKAAREAATAAGLDADAFAAYVLRENLPVEMRDTQTVEHGKTVTKKLPFVQKPGDPKAPFVALSEYTATLPAFDQRALKATPAQQQPAGVQYPAQSPSSTEGTTGDRVADFLTQRNAKAAAKPSPLSPTRRPAAAATTT